MIWIIWARAPTVTRALEGAVWSCKKTLDCAVSVASQQHDCMSGGVSMSAHPEASHLQTSDLLSCFRESLQPCSCRLSLGSIFTLLPRWSFRCCSQTLSATTPISKTTTGWFSCRNVSQTWSCNWEQAPAVKDSHVLWVFLHPWLLSVPSSSDVCFTADVSLALQKWECFL